MNAQNIFRKLCVVAGCAAFFFAANANEVQAASVTANTSGVVVAAIAISKTTDLNFGKFMSGGTIGTVVVDTAGNGNQSVTGGVTTTTGLGSSARAGKFSVTGEPSATYAITFTPTTLTGPGSPITIDTFTAAVDSGSIAGATATLPASGPQVLTVGATAHIGANQTSGTYGGTLDVAVNYN